MILYLMRHAEALDRSRDPRRGITDEGRSATEIMARHFVRMETPAPHQIWHSDKLRARQTAEIMAAALEGQTAKGQPLGIVRLVEKDFLQPMGAVEPASSALTEFARPLLIVGHMPFMARLCSLLLTGNPETESVVFATSALACLALDADWRLNWTAAPADLDDIG